MFGKLLVRLAGCPLTFINFLKPCSFILPKEARSKDPLYLLSLALIMLMFSVVAAEAKQIQKSGLPKQYSAIKIKDKIHIDGKASETVWNLAPWTEPFVDIEGKSDRVAPWTTRCKLLWDDENLYVFTQFDEQDIWAMQKTRDQAVYFDNAFEMFIDPDGDAHNYMEFQINALETVWDLFLTRPYRDGGAQLSGWDIRDLKKAVYIEGTLNQPKDRDKYWSIELAIPFRSLRYGKGATPAVGEVWKMNFSRVQWEVDVVNGVYEKSKNEKGRVKEASYYVWSPQGSVNLHLPEKWGAVQFVEDKPVTSFLSDSTERLKQELWLFYYQQQQVKKKEGKYAHEFGQLQKAFPDQPFFQRSDLHFQGTDLQFLIEIRDSATGNIFSIDHEGRQLTRELR